MPKPVNRAYTMSLHAAPTPVTNPYQRPLLSGAKRHRIEALESELARYDWTKGESLQSLFDRLIVLVNKISVLGSED